MPSPAYTHLDPRARALVQGWAAELAAQPAATHTMFRFLLAMVAVRRGVLREVGRGPRAGHSVVVLVDEPGETFYWVDDPLLDSDRERDALDALLAALAYGE
jgi:hypothetical protein